MKKTIFALAAVALSLSLSLTACASAKKAESGAKDTSKTGAAGVPYLTLNNGEKMPQFGIGTFNLGSDEVVYNSVLTALREGYRHIDTAHAYRAERGVGRAVKQFCKESGVPRSEIWVTSKVWPTEYGEGVTLPAIDRMLERLQLDYLDLLYIHQPAGDYFGAWKDMEKAVEMGKVRTLGISDFTLGGLAEEESLEICRLLDKDGIDSIEVSGNGTYVGGIRAGVNEGYFLPLAERLSDEIKTPVICVGGFRSRAVMEDALNKSNIALISLSRPLVREPDFPLKLQTGKSEVSKCVSCNGCYSSYMHRCVFNRSETNS